MEKERRTKALLLSTLVVVVATLSIAFASLSRTLNINGIGKMDTASWSVYFDNLSAANIVRGAQEVGKPKISDDKGIVQDINVKLSNPKDEISYTVDIVNDGTIDAEITMIKDIELTEAQKKVFEFKVTYTDTNEVLKDGDILPAGDTKNITINIKFKDDITEFDLPTESQTINLSYQITYTQYDGKGGEIIPDGGEVTTGKAVLAHDVDAIMSSEDPTVAPFFNGTIGRNAVESIEFLSSNVVPTEASSTVWDASSEGDNSIIGWYQDIDSNDLYEVYIGSDVNIYAPSDSTALFGLFVNLKRINFNNFNTSNVTNMYGMFNSCYLIENLDLSSFDTSNVITMEGMFGEENGEIISKLSNINLTGWNTKNVENMNSMFYGCEKLAILDLSSFDTSNVTNMKYMFGHCSSLANLNLSSFDTSNVTDMNYMFSDCSNLAILNLSSFNTSNVTTMNYMFYKCTSLSILDFRNADLLNVAYYSNMFYEVPTASQIIIKDETQRTWIISKYPDLTNVVLPSEL